MPRELPPKPTSSLAVHPIPVHRTATHFRLRKGGKLGPDQVHNDARGVCVLHHPIEEFDKDTITSRWGFTRGADYWVQFSKEGPPGSHQVLGTWKPFGLEGETTTIDGDTGIEVDPPYTPSAFGGGTMGEGLQFLAAMKGMVDSDSNARVSEARIAHETALASTREANANVLNIMTMFMKESRPAPPPQADPMLVQLLTKIDARLTSLEQEFEPEEPDEPEEVDYKKHLKLVSDVRKHGMSALWDYFKDQGAMAVVDALPMLKQKLPDVMMLMKPMLEKALTQMMGTGPAVGGGAQAHGAATPPAFPVARPHNGQTIPAPMTMPANTGSSEPEVEVS